ncbi:hypothetical protein BC826DRAFT_1072599 [Russula brevipes]|nr:hypothetical protein BC826DRAFT_1072599 [Russula brevipes]
MVLQLPTYLIEVLPLSSGKSGAVSVEAQLALPCMLRGWCCPACSTYLLKHLLRLCFTRAQCSPHPRRVIPRSRALQYRLGEYHASYIDRGTGHAVL